MKSISGWLGVALTVIFSGLWAYWGAFENFHEGWYSKSLIDNLLMMIFQYMLFSIVFTVLGLVAVRWKTTGLILYVVLIVFAVYFFNRAAFSVTGLMIAVPLALNGLLYYFGEPNPKKIAYILIIAIPSVIFLSVSITQGIKVSKRINDGDFNLRRVEGSGVVLDWAPRGPGWPDDGISWDEARYICSHLSEDGLTVTDEELNIWRLPTVDEAVRSMMLHGVNAGGIWHADEGKAEYEKTPDKESPLWDVYSKIIYYWTADTPEDNSDKAYIIVYHGGVFEKVKTSDQDYISFRAVKDARNE